MANMGYCRFENTLSDLRDCNDALMEGAEPKNLSADEARALVQLVQLCRDIGTEFEDFIR